MKSELKKNNIRLLALGLLSIGINANASDSISSGFSKPLEWSIGAEVSPAWVPHTNGFLKGVNSEGKTIDGSISGDLRADFSFSPDSREGMLYKGLYQGIGIGINTFFENKLLGTPVSVYVYQGAPIVNINKRLWFGYEWQFGAAFGWKHYNKETAENNAVVSTSVTAHMGIGLKLHYSIDDRWQLAFGIAANHYSNGNTSWPNAGINTIGASVGVSYILNPMNKEHTYSQIYGLEADKGRWFYDITVFGAWRKRIVTIGYTPEAELCPGKFAVLGLQFSPMRQLNRWVAVGGAIDLQWDESAGLEPYWIEGSYDENLKFERPPFGKQISAGISAHAELTMPIFSVNVGMGYDIINPKGNKAFYQSLTLKTFITKNIYLNTGYRLGSFKDPQNLMLGIGIRL